MRTLIAIALLVLVGSGTSWGDDHGNSPLAATPIATDGQLITACIEDAGDMDYFLFHATAGRTYRISTSHPTAEMDSLLYLIEPAGQGILAVDDNSGGETNARIVWTCTQSGIHFLMVRHAQATTGTGCYGLTVSIAQLDDHGNDRLSATPLASGVTAAGYLEETGDVDVFMIQVVQGYEYSIRFTSPGEDSSLSAQVFANGSTAPLATMISRGVTQTDTLDAAASEPLFLFIQSESGEPTGSYIVTIEKGDYADDHANDAAFATPIPVEWTEILGSLEVAGDVDWFQLDARQEAEYTFDLASTNGPGGIKVSIHGPDGQLLQESANTVSGGATQLLWQAPETGTYFLEISSTNGAGIYQLSVSSTLQLESIATYNPSGYSLDIAIVGDMAYLVVGTKGLLILDVSDPADPFEVGSHSTNGYAQAVAVSDHTAYVANRSEGVTLIDVSDPSRPVQIGVFDTPGSAHSITIYNDLVLISDQRGGLQIARIQSDRALVAVSAIDTKGYPAAIAIADPYALVAVGDAGIEIIDLSNPNTPASIGHLDLSGDASDIAVYGHLAYVATGYRGVRIVDVAIPAVPVEVGWISTTGEAIGVLISGSTLFVAEKTAGMSAYSLLDALEPQLIAQVDTPGEATAIAVRNGYVYVADRQEGMLIVQLLQ
ncbi:hypothetical protein KKG90_07985 [Candidatus Bipolaricaulota bacterium]|nr:hypothetical protein [Candidatus Bipolaricaulota bacterium]